MIEDLQKGGKSQPIGTRKEFGGREYIKTADGWKFVGKGKGKSAQKHIQDHHHDSNIQNKQQSSNNQSLDHHAANTPTENLRKIAHDQDSSQELRNAAQRELEERSNGEQNIETNNSSHSDNKDNKELDQDSKSGLPNEESVKQSDTLAEDNGPAKLSEETEGFSVKKDNVLTAGDTTNSKEDDINHKFEAFGRFTAGVIKGRMKSLIAYGSGGVGKTYTVTTELQKAGKKIFDPELHDPGDDEYDYVKMTGKMTAAAVYQAMYEHNGKILLFDDCDSVLQDENAINLFKGALDTSGDGTIDWGSAKKLKDSMGAEMPGKFAFNGRAIFISNLDIDGKAGDKIQPIVSRGYGINLAMDAAKTIDRIRHIATSKDGQLTNLKFPGTPNYTHEDMDSVLKYMDKYKNHAADLNVRTVGTLLAIKKDADEAGVSWEDDAKYVYLRKSEEMDIYNGSIFNQKQNTINKALGIDNRSIEQRKIDWCNMKKASLKGCVTSKDVR